LVILKVNYHCYVPSNVQTVSSAFLNDNTHRKTAEMNALAHTRMLQVLSQVQGLAVRTKWSFRTSVPFSSDVTQSRNSKHVAPLDLL